jgi:hypothetical protein
MKVSFSIFLVGAILIIFELLLLQADVSDKLSSLYFYIIIILFSFGGLVYYLERGIDGDPLREYTKKPKKRTTKSKPSK